LWDTQQSKSCKNSWLWHIVLVLTKKFSVFGFTHTISIANHVQFYDSTVSRGWIQSHQTQHYVYQGMREIQMYGHITITTSYIVVAVCWSWWCAYKVISHLINPEKSPYAISKCAKKLKIIVKIFNWVFSKRLLAYPKERFSKIQSQISSQNTSHC